jgi:hypothetical protein
VGFPLVVTYHGCGRFTRQCYDVVSLLTLLLQHLPSALAGGPCCSCHCWRATPVLGAVTLSLLQHLPRALAAALVVAAVDSLLTGGFEAPVDLVVASFVDSC